MKIKIIFFTLMLSSISFSQPISVGADFMFPVFSNPLKEYGSLSFYVDYQINEISLQLNYKYSQADISNNEPALSGYLYSANAFLFNGFYNFSKLYNEVIPYLGVGIGYYIIGLDKAKNLTEYGIGNDGTLYYYKNTSVDNGLGLNIYGGILFFPQSSVNVNMRLVYEFIYTKYYANIDNLLGNSWDETNNVYLNSLLMSVGIKVNF